MENSVSFFSPWIKPESRGGSCSNSRIRGSTLSTIAAGRKFSVRAEITPARNGSLSIARVDNVNQGTWWNSIGRGDIGSVYPDVTATQAARTTIRDLYAGKMHIRQRVFLTHGLDPAARYELEECSFEYG